jgi:hypothetical protein
MDAETNLKARLPSRQVTEGPERAPAALTASDRPEASRVTAAKLTPDRSAIALELSGVAAVFKRTSSVPDLKPAGRDVAKDLFEARLKKPKLSGPAHCFDAEEACLEAVTTRKYREGDMSVMCDAGPKCGPATAALAKDLFRHSEVTIRRAGAVIHAGGAAEVRSYADI